MPRRQNGGANPRCRIDFRFGVEAAGWKRCNAAGQAHRDDCGSAVLITPARLHPPRKKIMLLRFCRDDFKAHCPGVDVGEGRAVACLNENLAQLTPDCRGALAKLGS